MTECGNNCNTCPLREICKKNKNEFAENGYVVLRGVIDTKMQYEYALNKIKTQPFMCDTQVPDTPAYYNDPLMSIIHKELLTTIEKATGKKLFCTYNYYRVYKRGDVLASHKDRPSCEISASLCIGFDSPEIWRLYIKNRKGETVPVLLQPGDMLIYDGVNLEHWRDKFYGKNQVQSFFHYVDQSGKYAEHKDDKLHVKNIGMIFQEAVQ